MLKLSRELKSTVGGVEDTTFKAKPKQRIKRIPEAKAKAKDQLFVDRLSRGQG